MGKRLLKQKKDGTLPAFTPPEVGLLFYVHDAKVNLIFRMGVSNKSSCRASFKCIMNYMKYIESFFFTFSESLFKKNVKPASTRLSLLCFFLAERQICSYKFLAILSDKLSFLHSFCPREKLHNSKLMLPRPSLPSPKLLVRTMYSSHVSLTLVL